MCEKRPLKDGLPMEIKSFLIDENCTMLQAMEVLDKVIKKILFVTHDGSFVATITDGDVRRWILKNGELGATVKDVANYNPKFLQEGQKSIAERFMREHSIEAVPIVNGNNEIVTIVLKDEKSIEQKKNLNLPIVIMAGGLGTRLYPYTKILPKPLIPIGEIPIVQHIMERFNDYGCRNFYLIVNHKKNMIKAYFNEIEKPYEIVYADEEQPLGTGGGLSMLKGKINGTFVLSNCDILIDADYEKIYQYHKSKNNVITMVCSVKNIKIPYGVIELDGDGHIASMHEKPEFSFITNTGMYFVESRVIDEIEANTPIGFPDIIEKYKSAGENIGVFPISETGWMDMGQLDELEKMRSRIEDN